MNRSVRNIALGAAIALCAMTAVQAQNLPNTRPGSGANNDPYNSPLHRANPNSRQGTQPVTPPGRSPVTPPILRAPTLENGGIRNGYPARETPRPSSESAPRTNSQSR
ncbi:hypothetical protein TRP66_06675 [Pseudomonas sp. JDS28PS106]|uniref:hypothetical protein n=1 Tax=Pseudomonas sp. JDS28PS106 TaxID=2497235 RepID=UPI002FD5DC2D